MTVYGQNNKRRCNLNVIYDISKVFEVVQLNFIIFSLQTKVVPSGIDYRISQERHQAGRRALQVHQNHTLLILLIQLGFNPNNSNTLTASIS